MKHHLAYQYQTDYRLKTIEAFWTFPHGYYDRKTKKRLFNFPAVQEFTSWHLKILRGDDYETALNAKYKELTNETAGDI